MRASTAALIVPALLAACGGSGSRHPKHRHVTQSVTAAGPVTAAVARPVAPPPVRALVTAETENRLLLVVVPSGRVVRSIPVARDPEDLATDGSGGDVVVVSAAVGAVTLLDGESLRPLKVLTGFDRPHIAAITPDGDHAYVTDDARGTLTAIDLVNLRVTSTIQVGSGAHHMSFDAMHSLAWVALGESARTIVILSTEDLNRPKLIGRFAPGFEVHDLAFSNDGHRVWLTSADSSEVTVLNGSDERLLFRVPVGPPPQHVALSGAYAYLTSGYGSTIEQVDARTGRVLHRASTPHGSFELAADDRYVAVSSLLRGTLAMFTPQLKPLRVVQLAAAAREVALSLPAGSPP